MTATLDPAEAAKFARIADSWWAPDGPFAPLHKMNPARLGVIRDMIGGHFALNTRGPRMLAGLKLIDLGCGGGLVTEPMARLGATITALDAAEETIQVARLHADACGLAIDYRVGVPEDLPGDLAGGFDVALALEIVEHVADLDAFLAAAARTLRPGGVLILSTINRTPQAYALAIVAAERVLRWLPVGTHDYTKLVAPAELSAACARAGLKPQPPVGLTLNPLHRTWAAGSDVSMNYLMAAGKP
ncbi:MAG: bifunctional 2-polyprenyl-6-hydroxyphenol methylase/3-demethylubiquinol 3-O-methyltransferase UbiG [Caulobacterales bacterium]|jgi:2-polyprenyl-6-hydroxyphenyl methylase/3-demethylubiquinone-9 3-methyltransferase